MFPFTTGNYIKKVRSVRPDRLVELWPQNEPVGHGVSTGVIRGYDGAYTAVTLGQPGIQGSGLTSAGYDGATSYNNIYSAGLNADFDGAEGTLLAWAKVSGAGVWTDGVARYIARLHVDADNEVEIDKDIANNDIYWVYEAGGTIEDVVIQTESSVDWICYVVSWSKSGNAMKGFRNGVQVQTTQTIAGTWAGDLDATKTLAGAGATTPSSVWDGDIGPVALWSAALSADEIRYLGTA